MMSPHWNTCLELSWMEMKKYKKRAKRSTLTVDWEIFQAKIKSFERENRRRRRIFRRRTEALLESCPNNYLAEAISKDKRRREVVSKLHSNSGELLNPTSFTIFMGMFFKTKTKRQSRSQHSRYQKI